MPGVIVPASPGSVPCEVGKLVVGMSRGGSKTGIEGDGVGSSSSSTGSGVGLSSWAENRIITTINRGVRKIIRDERGD